ncbi:MAG: DUF4037 domain-containing protein, partial [Clostridia bacterium]|nr:DUF4037 domain-containing protein [Clostridia bacterium]
REFGGIFARLACGICGSGSECFGYDDDISKDHDLEPGFIIFLPGESEIDRRTEFLLERAYEKLPDEFCGLKRSKASPVGGKRRGVIRTADFFVQKTGTPDGALAPEQWLALPEYSLAEAVNGKIFFDGSGSVSAIRERLKEYPRDIMLKKLAGALLLAAQSGQYNYSRCIARNETGAAQYACFEFAQNAMKCCFLLCGRYMPFYKWSFRALRELPGYGIIADTLEYIISTGNSAPQDKQERIDSVCAAITRAIREKGLLQNETPLLEETAYSINGLIRDEKIRNMHVLAGV